MNCERDVVVGTAVAGRMRRELEAIVGPFLNLLPLRVRVQPGESFVALVRRIREAALDAYAHQEVPFEKLVEELAPQRALSQHPIFQAMVVAQNTPIEAAEMPGLQTEWLAPVGALVKYDLTLSIVQGARRISGAFEYAADLFHSDQVERLAKQFERLVEQAMAEPEGAVGQVDVLDVEERRRVLTEFNRTASASAAARSPAEWLTEAAQQYGDRVALEDGAGLRWSYDQLHKRAALLAGHLATLGAGPDRIVGICLDRSAEMVLALLAVVKSGAAYLPVEPDWPAARLQEILGEASPVVVLTTERRRTALAGIGCPLLPIDGGRVDYPQRRLEIGTDPDCLAYVIYTSGSTGRPNGVAVSCGALLNHLAWAQQALPLGPGDTILQKYSVAFDAGTLEIFQALCAGARLFLAPPGPIDGTELARLAVQHGVTALDVTPVLLDSMCDAGVPSGLRRIVSGGNLSPKK